ncbi:hypothetical protein, partial [Thermococcus sp. Bubb.Bath]|uniref:hypothetical protein n=1 Tax=Thermococcus sp. Bubb.Bath TaxID=1638242 RepID=UPI00143ACB0E
NGQVIGIPITNPEDAMTFNVIATYNGHQVGSDTYTVTPQDWSVSITPSRTWAYKYVPTEINFTVKPNVTAVNPHDLVVKVDGNVTDS